MYGIAKWIFLQMSVSNRRSGYQEDHCAEKDLESIPRLFKGVLLCVGLGFKGFGSRSQRWVCSELASCYSLLKWKRYLWPRSLQQLGARAHKSVIPFPALFCLRRNGKAYLLLLGGIPHFPAGNDDSHHSGSSHPLVRHQWDHRKQQRQAFGGSSGCPSQTCRRFLDGWAAPSSEMVSFCFRLPVSSLRCHLPLY